MSAHEIVKDIHWVGAVDWDRRHFHGFSYTTPNGTTYNAYLIIDEKITLVDTVLPEFFGEMADAISGIIDPKKIEYIIANHVEIDHSGALPRMLELCPNATVLCSAKCRDGLKKNYHSDWNFRIVKTGDTVSLGKKTLEFIEAPMIHWPDSMFTYVREDELLLPNDAFGQHFASAERFDDEIDERMIMNEAAKYYANILLDLGSIIHRKLEEVEKMGIPIKIIAPSHGIIWRKDPAKIVEAYKKWSSGVIDSPRVIVIYDTMWGTTEKMARNIVEGVAAEGVAVRLYRAPFSDHTSILKDVLDTKGILVGSSTIHNSFLPTLASLLEEFETLKPKNRIGASFGSFGWGRGACRRIEESLKAAGIDIVMPALETQYVPDKDGFKAYHQFGRDFAKKVKESGVSVLKEA
ncbi:MAG: flavodoxin domain-containing protein [Candidatus Omnitrophica bacterium]|nr:flavodoxin domain-containing protein [Candidatus Omnitrophota bacterium]